ncbi:uncharacterized protein LOC134825942 [Bolinopsis microptera]|uniref:uncharacterized protein LOC134825942 n=1 Tax=Bolinopsis microptera TaxID=2820187 RepID=UPI003078AC99
MPRFQQVSEGHVSTATEILWNVGQDVYAPIKPVPLCPVCSGLASVIKTLKKRELSDVEEIMDAREAAGTCLVMSEILKQLIDMMANVEEIIERENRTKLFEIDLCIGSLQSLATASQKKMETLVERLELFSPDHSQLKSNWGEFTTWLCGILLSLYCIQRPKIWNKLAKSDTSFNIKSLMMSPNKSERVGLDKSVSFVEDTKEAQKSAFKLVTTTLVEEMLTFSEHLNKVQKQLNTISALLKQCGVTHFPKPLPY